MEYRWGERFERDLPVCSFARPAGVRLEWFDLVSDSIREILQARGFGLTLAHGPHTYDAQILSAPALLWFRSRHRMRRTAPRIPPSAQRYASIRAVP